MFKGHRPMLALALVVFGAGFARAQGADSSKVTIHGYLTQGVAGSTKLPIHGIPAGEVSTDQRIAVFQLRYALSRSNSVTFQLGHRRYGVSALNTADGTPVVDVAYVQHRSPRYGTISVGRTQIPFGIYSGIRDMGVLLPFYRAPENFYAEGFRALDGLQLTRHQSLGDRWSLETTAFLGGMDVKSLVRSPTKPEFAHTTRVERAYGAFVTLFTPINGLEVSGQGARFRDLQTGSAGAANWYSATGASLNFTRTHGYVRSEYRLFQTISSREAAHYVQVTLKPTARWSVNTQTQLSRTRILATGRSFQSINDRAASVGYSLASWVVKVEQHAAAGYAYFNKFVSTMDRPSYTHYTIVSVSTSF